MLRFERHPTQPPIKVLDLSLISFSDGITSSAADYDQSESVLTTEDTDADNMWQYRTVKQPTTALGK